ncbi:MAG TPA: 50S ribosomal protein L18 [Spirochaetia bacterium]|nr:50S ribosomal protein L18 [Spirochaetia bacterium]
MKKLDEKKRRLLRRRTRIRGRITGTAERPRLSVYKSNRYVYIQVVDDAAGRTLASANNAFGELKALKSTVADAGKIGEALGAKMLALNLKQAVFDRNGNLYHGVIKAVADGVRKAGVQL